jgi:uncharacterized repeat protein (TIGR03803 family)
MRIIFSVHIRIDTAAAFLTLKRMRLVAAVALLVATSSFAQSQITLLHNFTNSPDGGTPYTGGGMAISGDTLFGTTDIGGASGYGTIYSVHTDGTGYRILYSFSGGVDGGYVPSGLILSSNILYGTTLAGGTNGDGVVFAFNTDDSTFTVLHSFAATTPPITGPLGVNTIVTNAEGARLMGNC